MAVIRKIKLPSEAAARDIGALSSNVIYDGDSGVTTTLNDKIQSIFTAIGNINSFEIAIVSELPATGDDHTIYFVPESAGSTTHNEYMYVGDQWELIGTTTIDLSNYLQKTDISVTSNLNSGTNIGSITIDGTTTTLYSPSDADNVYALNLASYTKQQLSEGIQDSADAAVIADIAANYEEGVTKVKFSFIDNSATPDVVATAEGPKFSITLNGNTFNDVMKFTFAGVYLDDATQALAPPAYIGSIYIVPNANLVMLFGADVVRALDSLEGEIGTLNTNVNDLTQTVNNLATVASTGDYNDLSNTPDLSGYITSSDLPTIPENISDLNDDIGIATMSDIPNVPSNISAFNNDAGYISDLSVNQILSSGTAIGSIYVNGATTTLYAPSQSAESDPVFTASPAYSIAQTDIDNWNDKFYVVEIEITSVSPLTLSFVNSDDSYSSILDKVEAGVVVYLSLGGSSMSQVTDVNYTQNIINFRSIYYENNSLSYYNFQIHSDDTITLDEHLHIPTTPAPTYSLSMSGPTITLTPSSGTASTITLPIYDGTVALADAAVVG